jgi:hypothetical protein
MPVFTAGTFPKNKAELSFLTEVLRSIEPTPVTRKEHGAYAGSDLARYRMSAREHLLAPSALSAGISHQARGTARTPLDGESCLADGRC